MNHTKNQKVLSGQNSCQDSQKSPFIDNKEKSIHLLNSDDLLDQQGRCTQAVRELLPIDTLHLSTDDFNWMDQPQCSQPGARFFYEEQVSKALCLKIFPARLVLELTVPKISHSSNTYPISLEDFKQFMNFEIEQLKDEYGLQFKQWELRVKRLDIFTQTALTYPPAYLLKQLSYIFQFGHMKQLSLSPRKDMTSIYFGNHSKQIILYDKFIKQLLDNQTFYHLEEEVEENLLRVELRLLKSKVCRDCGFTTAADLLSFENLSTCFHTHLRPLVKEFRNLSKDETILFSQKQNVELTNTIENSDFRVNHLSELMLTAEHVAQFFSHFNGFDQFLNYIDQLNISTSKKFRLKQEAKRLQQLPLAEEELLANYPVYTDFTSWIPELPELWYVPFIPMISKQVSKIA